MDLGWYIANSSEKSLPFAPRKVSLTKFSWMSATRTLNLELVLEL